MEPDKNFDKYLIENLGKQKYDTPEEVKTALTTISGMSFQDHPEETIEAVFSIVNSGYKLNSATEQEIALRTHGILKKTKPQSEEDASKVLKLCKGICLSRPNLAEDAIGTMKKVFRGSSESEKVQKECLSTLESLNGFRSTFDDGTKSCIDDTRMLMQKCIKIQEIKRSSGLGTTWKKPTPANTEMPDEINANAGFERFNNAYSATGRSVATGHEEDFSKRIDKINQEIDAGTYGKNYGTGFDIGYDYGR